MACSHRSLGIRLHVCHQTTASHCNGQAGCISVCQDRDRNPEIQVFPITPDQLRLWTGLLSAALTGVNAACLQNLTQNGSHRDQNDANQTGGAQLVWTITPGIHANCGCDRKHLKQRVCSLFKGFVCHLKRWYDLVWQWSVPVCVWQEHLGRGFWFSLC